MTRFLSLAILLFVPSFLMAQEDGSLTHKDITLKYKIHGKADGEPVILLHGFVVTGSLQWTVPGITEKLGEKFKVIVYDHRGHGRSSRPLDDSKYGLEMVHDVARLMEHLKLEKAHIVGYSMGAFISHKFAVLYPNKVKSLVIGGAGWLTTGKPTEVMDEIATSLDSGKGLEPLFNNVRATGTRPLPPEVTKRINDMAMLINNPKCLACVARGMKQFVLTEAEVKTIKSPTLCLVGDEDPLSEMAKILEDQRPNLKVVYLKGADHVAAYARQDFINSLCEFLGKQIGK